MQRRTNLIPLILAVVVALGLTPLIVAVGAQAQIAFVSDRNGNSEIYVMDADGENPQNLTNNRRGEVSPAWFNSPFSVSRGGKQFTMWGRLKQVDR